MPVLSLGNVAIVSDPELVKQVFTAPADVLLGGEGVGPVAAIYSSGSMFVQEEPEHLRRALPVILPAPACRATPAADHSWS
jgi:cytochrome P450